MKKLSVLFSSLLVLLFLSFRMAPGHERFSPSKGNLAPESPWTVSSYGFMVFPTVEDIEQCRDTLEGMTLGSAQSYISSIGFTNSLGLSLYSHTLGTDPVTESQSINYILNTSKVIQVGNIILKPVGETDCDVSYQFVLAMISSNLGSGSYSNLVSGVFDDTKMNKIATNHSISAAGLPTRMAEYPTGVEDEPNPCPQPDVARRPFWGWGNYSCSGSPCFNPITNTWGTTYMYCEPSYYIFWINVSSGDCWGLDCGANCPPAGA